MFRSIIVPVLLLLPIGTCFGQAEKNFTIPNNPFPGGTRININQVETTAFPRVKVFASVTRSGLPLGGLTAKNFRVRENDIDQEPIVVTAEMDTISAVLLLDVSGSMKGAIEDTKAAAIGFLKTLGENDRVQVITFHERIDTIYPLGNDFKAAENAISKIRHRGDTALYDGVHRAVLAIREVPGRRAVIVLSDGVDDDGRGNQLSKRDLYEPLMLALQTNIPIYTIGLGFKMDADILKILAKSSGAEYANAPTREELDELYAKIGRQLSNQYAIEYTTSHPMDNGLREVKLDFVIPSSKPYAAPAPVKNNDGSVTFKAPDLSDEDLNKLAQMAGVGKMAKANKIMPLKKFFDELSPEWPKGIPSYEKAAKVEVSEKEDVDTFTFEVPESGEDFLSNYSEILKKDNWTILSNTKAGSLAIVKASLGQSEMTIGIQGGANKSNVNVDYLLPSNRPIVVDKNNVNQIIAAEGRDVIVSGTDGVIIVSGGSGKLTVSGSKNKVQCDTVNNFEITGSENTVISGALGSGDITGDRNELAWGSGIDGKEPTVNATGAGNKIMRLE